MPKFDNCVSEVYNTIPTHGIRFGNAQTRGRNPNERGASRLCPVPCLALGFYGAWGLETMGRSPNELVSARILWGTGLRLDFSVRILRGMGFEFALFKYGPLGFYGERGFNSKHNALGAT